MWNAYLCIHSNWLGLYWNYYVLWPGNVLNTKSIEKAISANENTRRGGVVVLLKALGSLNKRSTAQIATKISEIGYILLLSCDMTEIILSNV